MATKTNFDKIKLFEPSAMRGLAHRYERVFDQRVFEDGKDYRGKQFPEYKTSYKKLLAKDFTKKDGGRYKGYEGGSLTTGGKKVSKRLPELRGITRDSLKPGKVGTDYFQLVFTGEGGFLADALSKKGRDFIEDIPSKEKTWLIKELGKLVDKQYDKIPDVINLGK